MFEERQNKRKGFLGIYLSISTLSYDLTKKYLFFDPARGFESNDIVSTPAYNGVNFH